MIVTPFGAILRRAVECTPGAVGSVFAACDGETVDAWTSLGDNDWAIITATYGITVNYVRSALHTFHFGDVEFIYITHEKLEIMIQIVTDDYFVMLALTPPVHVGTAQRNLCYASREISLELQ